ncbi:unnamed protein product [Moneuplotes crassus]|uniref:ADP-ribosylglycohydrolase n=1 Tax=Euplotes crassus TaxID=5936 RepID=A0AAD1XHW5_EUPCR|nr:unnamed protein product [Moneuplotes crassus]
MIGQDSLEKDPKFDRAKGAIMGALCGDAIGAVLEYHPTEITHEDAINAFTMPGGGSHGNGELKCGKGQITDDGEMVICLMHALCAGEGKLDRHQIAYYYGKWMKTDPFDLGKTCGSSLRNANPDSPNPDKIQEDAKESEGSLSNGALMRATPIAVFCHKMICDKTEDTEEEADTEEDISKSIKHKNCVYKAAVEDAMFTHCNQTVLWINYLYCYIISLIINETELTEVYSIACKEIEESKNEDIISWFEESKNEELGSLKKHAGWIKHAFICCMRYLRLATESENPGEAFYANSLIEILKGDGDTDTNACIAGGLIGSIIGYSNLPSLSTSKVLSWPSSPSDGIPRASFLHPSKHANPLIKSLFLLSPTNLQIS